ncbi:ribosome biogenesis GTPase YlqF [uncultured Desulfobacter sp.]|uniref:ribosome biogenesis GTPase YlqF n=1 Tax=uncultured Desulfobacter sp. TaxID=240139 RepID=UPI002AAB6028|nr:ribosome biogenesis GTPase YlqF [uncultured Desulfobacter sp.]
MNIQWFPGHMLETKNQLKNSIARVDALLEVVDARLPLSSSNPFVDRIATGKNRMKVLNKADIADPEATQAWLDYFNRDLRLPAAAICGTSLQDASQALETLVSQVDRNQARKAKVMVVGIPNTGKSTILNTLAGRKVAKTGNVPAITRHQQRTSLKGNIDIYDTPGILWPVIEPLQRALALAVSGAISDTAIDYHEIAHFAAQLLLERYPACLAERYPFLDPLPKNPQALIETVGKARGCLKKGGYVDSQKASQLIIRDLRSGRLGRVSFETPKDINVNHDTDQ